MVRKDSPPLTPTAASPTRVVTSRTKGAPAASVRLGASRKSRKKKGNLLSTKRRGGGSKTSSLSTAKSSHSSILSSAAAGDDDDLDAVLDGTMAAKEQARRDAEKAEQEAREAAAAEEEEMMLGSHGQHVTMASGRGGSSNAKTSQTKSGASRDIADRFTNSTSISSDQFFGRNEYSETTAADRQRLNQFSGNQAISSAAFFNREEDHMRGGHVGGGGQSFGDFFDSVKSAARKALR